MSAFRLPPLSMLNGAVIAVIVAISALVLAFSGVSRLTLVIIGASAIALYPAYRLLTGRERDPFAPIHLFVLYIFFTINIRTVVILNGGSGILQPLYDAGGVELRRLLELSLIATSIFLVSLYAGYYAPLAARLIRPVPTFGLTRQTRRDVLAAVMVAAAIAIPVGILLYLRIGASVAEGRFTEETRAGGVTWMGFLLRFAVVGALVPLAIAVARPRKLPMIVSAGAAVLVAFGVFLLWPKKIVLANQVLAVLVCIHYLRARIPLRSLAMAGVFALLMLPVLSAFRYLGVLAFSAENLVELSQVVWQNPSFVFDALLLRSFGADSLVLIIDEMQNGRHLELGSTFMEVTRFFIPRVFWPDKPMTYAIIFGQQFLARTAYFSVDVSGTPTVVGELLLNFGILGLTVGGWLVGLFLRLPYEYLVVRSANTASVLAYSAFLASTVMLVEGPIFPQIMDMSVSVGMVLALVMVMNVSAHVSRVWATGDPRARRI